TTVSLVVSAPVDFTLAASPSSQTVTPGGSTSYSVTISPTGDIGRPTTELETPRQIVWRGRLAPNPATASSTLSVTTGTGTPVGPYTLTIPFPYTTLFRSTTVSLVVSAPVDFTLAASPSSQTVTPGGSTSYSVTISPTG